LPLPGNCELFMNTLRLADLLANSLELPEHIDGAIMDEYILMPNHFHFKIMIMTKKGQTQGLPLHQW